jgi:hypothetical protein
MNIDTIVSLAKSIKDGDKIAVLYVRPVKTYKTARNGNTPYTGVGIMKESLLKTVFNSASYFDKILATQGTNSNPTGKPQREYNHVDGILYESEGKLYIRFSYVKKDAEAVSHYFEDGKEVSYQEIERFLTEGERLPSSSDKASNQKTAAGHDVKETSPNVVRQALYALDQVIELQVEPKA